MDPESCSVVVDFLESNQDERDGRWPLVVVLTTKLRRPHNPHVTGVVSSHAQPVANDLECFTNPCPGPMS